MRLLERDEPLDPRAERELDAVDRALAGDPVDPDLADWAELTAMLSAEAPETRDEWAAELDRRAVAGFRGEGDSGSLRGSLGRLGEVRLSRVLAPAGALATLVVVVVVAVSTLNEGDAVDGTEAGGDAVGQVSSDSASGGTASSAEETAPGSGSRLDALRNASPDLSGDAVYQAGIAGYPADGTAFKSFDRAAKRIAPGTENRKIERDVRLSLSTKPDEVRETSDQVISITRSLDGIIASSQVTEAGKSSQATLELTIPTKNLDTAIDRLTDLANVESLDEATVDITKPYVSAQDRLRDAEAKRRELLQALGNATTETEAQALELQIADARREISRAKATFDNVSRRASLSDVSVSVVGDPNAKEDRTIGDWFDDAVTVLRDVAGIMLISAAILVPLGILVALTWLAIASFRRARRERALD